MYKARPFRQLRERWTPVSIFWTAMTLLFWLRSPTQTKLFVSGWIMWTTAWSRMFLFLKSPSSSASSPAPSLAHMTPLSFHLKARKWIGRLNWPLLLGKGGKTLRRKMQWSMLLDLLLLMTSVPVTGRWRRMASSGCWVKHLTHSVHLGQHWLVKTPFQTLMDLEFAVEWMGTSSRIVTQTRWSSRHKVS